MNAVVKENVASDIEILKVRSYIKILLQNCLSTSLSTKIVINLEELKEIQKLLNRHNHKIKLYYHLVLESIPNDISDIDFNDVEKIEFRFLTAPNKELLHNFLSNLNKNTKLLFTINDMSCIDLDSLEYMKTKFKKEINFHLYELAPEEHFYKTAKTIIYNNQYNVFKMIKIKKIIDEIAKNTDGHNNDDKIIFACNFLLQNFKYNYDMDNAPSDKKLKFEDESLYNVLINKRGTGNCLSVALFNLLKSMDIDCYIERDTNQVVTQDECSINLSEWLKISDCKKYIK